MTSPIRTLFTFGTRPEAIKLAPLILQMRARRDFRPIVCVTGQHREMLDHILNGFGIKPNYDLRVMRPNQSLAGVTEKILNKVDLVVAKEKPDLLIVQGDTTTAFVSALAAFYRKVPVAHVEAGLRTNDFEHPFPEELNRVLIDRFASYCFAPTKHNKRTLLAENIPSDRIYITGNTGIDALLITRDRVCSAGPGKWKSLWRSAWPAVEDKSKRLLLITMHRRESFGPRIKALMRAVRNLARSHRDWEFVYPVHLNPNVRKAAAVVLKGLPNVHLISPLPYEPFVFLMQRAEAILTDSGGIQEEAPSLHKPVIVLRQRTERKEAVDAGTVILAGNTGRGLEKIVERVVAQRWQRRVRRNPYGDGKATARILKILRNHTRG
jgi:UDP-N-acetylglucosamine 2-epimerase (non-hydrolysing)